MLRQEARLRVSLIVNGMHEIGQKRYRGTKKAAEVIARLPSAYCQLPTARSDVTRLGCDHASAYTACDRCEKALDAPPRNGRHPARD